MRNLSFVLFLTRSLDIHLISPSTGCKALEAALAQNPHLTSLPSPKPDILAPDGLTYTTPTAEILRLPEVQATVTGDFVVLPCDLVSELPGEALLEAWLVDQRNLGSRSTIGESGRGGGLGVYFETRGDDYIKGAETDFIITTALPSAPVPACKTSLRPNISKLLYTTTSDSLRDMIDEEQAFPVRTGLVRKHGKIRILTTFRDAHIYLFPHWIMDWVKRNDRFDSISEDVLGWWVKCEWQDGLARKLHLSDSARSTEAKSLNGERADRTTISGNIDLASMSSTHTSSLDAASDTSNERQIPSMLAYIHPAPITSKSAALIRRVDTSALLLSTSLHIASLPEDPHPHAHASKISTPSLVAPHTTIEKTTTLIGANTSVAKHCTIKTSCIGSNCLIAEGAKISGSLLMDGVSIGEKVVLQGCIIGRRSAVGKGAILKECEVQEGFVVDDGVEGMGEKYSVFEGLDDAGIDEDEPIIAGQ